MKIIWTDDYELSETVLGRDARIVATEMEPTIALICCKALNDEFGVGNENGFFKIVEDSYSIQKFNSK